MDLFGFALFVYLFIFGWYHAGEFAELLMQIMRNIAGV